MKLVVHTGSRRWRGNEAVVGTLVEGLLERGHELLCSCVAGSEVEARLGAIGSRTTGVRPRGDLDLPSAWLFARMLGRESPDGLLLTDLRRMPWGAWAGRRAGVPRVVGRLGLPRALPARGLRRAALLRGVDRWYVSAQEIADVLVSGGPGLEGAVHVVPNGVEVRDAVEPVDLRAELGLAPHTVVVLGAGIVAPRKGFDLLIRAVADAGDRVHLAVAGDDANAAPERELAVHLGVSDRVHFLGHRRDLPGVFAGSDLYVLSSREEGCPIVLLEAIAAGAPAVVATDVAGASRILGFERGGDGRATAGPGWTRGSTGWLVARDDGAALADAVADALRLREEDPAACGTLGDAARERVGRRFTTERMVEAVERVLFE